MEKIKISDLVPDPNQPRKNKPEAHLRALAESIANEGLNNPIIVRENPDGGFIIINGECRWTSFLFIKEYWDGKPKHGWSFDDGEFTVDCIVRDFTESGEILKNQIMDNVMRLEMGPLETLESISRLLENFSVEECAKAFGISAETIKADLPILTLPANIKAAWDSGKLPKIVARKIASLPARQHIHAYEWCINGKTSDAMLTKIRAYVTATMQLDVFSQALRTTTGKEKKDARVLFGKIFKCMTTVANSPLLTSKTELLIAANAAKTEQIEKTAKTMEKIANKLLAELKAFKAREKSAVI